ncbi:MAG TPA: hypothetical protein VI670_26350 [Thermoanaerobaculia bacterium]
MFQPTLAAATAVAQQRYGGDLVVFLSDGSPACRQAREQVFGATPLGQFLAANFAAVEVAAGSADAAAVRARYHVPDERPRIIIASDRLEHLRLHIVRIDRIKEANVLRQLKAIKASKTIAEYRRAR